MEISKDAILDAIEEAIGDKLDGVEGIDKDAIISRAADAAAGKMAKDQAWNSLGEIKGRLEDANEKIKSANDAIKGQNDDIKAFADKA